MLRNLHNINFADYHYVVENAKKLLLNSKGDAYLISMSLIVSAQLGNEDLYQEAHTEMLKAMADRKNDTFAAWLYGRILLAANNIGNKPEDEQAASDRLNELLESNKDKKDCFKAWAFAYLAASSNDVYQAKKMTMKLAAEQLTNRYLELKRSPAVPEQNVQEARSNALWGWVMATYAAANARDKNMYDRALENICHIMGIYREAEALIKGLLRTSVTNDYPAWALGIVQLAAARMNEDKLFNQLQEPLRISIEDAKLSNATAETVLAIVSHQLAIENNKLLKDQPQSNAAYKK